MGGKRRNKKGSVSADFGEDSDSSYNSNRSSPFNIDDSIEMIKTGSQLSQISNPELDDQINIIIDGLLEKTTAYYY